MDWGLENFEANIVQNGHDFVRYQISRKHILELQTKI
jgi:hypothetical protein